MKVFLLSLTLLSASADASLFDKFVEKYMKNVFSKSHGEGLPEIVEKKVEAELYRQDFLKEYGIVEYTDDYGLTQYKNNRLGLGLIKKGNEKEGSFTSIQKGRNPLAKKVVTWKNGKQFIKRLQEYTKAYGCIPKVTSTSHGWRSSGRTGEGHGLSGNKGFNGIYVSYKFGPEKIAKNGSRTLKKHLSQEIKNGSVKFCNSCINQFFACNVSTTFANELTKLTGCQTIVSTAQSSPYFKDYSTKELESKALRGTHYWYSAAGVLEERTPKELKEKGGRNASWYRVTPLKDESNKVIDLVKENLGELYIAI